LKFVSKATISNRETGYSKPRLEMALIVSEILDEDVAFLFGYIYKNLVQKITYFSTLKKLVRIWNGSKYVNKFYTPINLGLITVTKRQCLITERNQNQKVNTC